MVSWVSMVPEGPNFLQTSQIKRECQYRAVSLRLVFKLTIQSKVEMRY
ncbi:hypothetical protein E2C01_099548 [Portunus trituberculatus]|uniref:Uncharacterized protein n=1 Tax=Portunus trituberculatus TaxID=210409 RepID=A0A5B7K9Y0_PORTR|nr:hypothetical protein [Portunus trituberculatus]